MVHLHEMITGKQQHHKQQQHHQNMYYQAMISDSAYSTLGMACPLKGSTKI